jgi:hypothetical protein
MKNESPYKLVEKDDGFAILFNDPIELEPHQAFHVDGLTPEQKEKSMSLMTSITKLCNVAFACGAAQERCKILLAPNQLLGQTIN